MSVGSSLYFHVLQQGTMCMAASWQGHQGRGFRRGGWECELSRTCRGALSSSGVGDCLFTVQSTIMLFRSHPALAPTFSLCFLESPFFFHSHTPQLQSWVALTFSSSLIHHLNYFPFLPFGNCLNPWSPTWLSLLVNSHTSINTDYVFWGSQYGSNLVCFSILNSFLSHTQSRKFNKHAHFTQPGVVWPGVQSWKLYTRSERHSPVPCFHFSHIYFHHILRAQTSASLWPPSREIVWKCVIIVCDWVSPLSVPAGSFHAAYECGCLEHLKTFTFRHHMRQTTLFKAYPGLCSITEHILWSRVSFCPFVNAFCRHRWHRDLKVLPSAMLDIGKLRIEF